MKNNKAPYRRFINLPISIETDNCELNFELEDIAIKHYPERPMPQCMNPDNPAYYDPGDPEDNEFEDIDNVIYQIETRFNLEIENLKLKLAETINNLNSDVIQPLLTDGI